MAKLVVAQKRKQKETGWRRHIEEQAGSGLSIVDYCRRHGLREPGFYWWRRELVRRDARQSPPPAAFVPVTVAAEMAARSGGYGEGRMEIMLPGDRRVQVVGPVDRQRLADVLSVLEERADRRGDQRC
jgi:hypothetical protein